LDFIGENGGGSIADRFPRALILEPQRCSMV
jgi:hypothetical protein